MEAQTEKYLFEIIQLGIEAEELIKNNAWKKLIKGFQEDALQSIIGLMKVNPEDANMVRKLQNDIKQYTDMVQRAQFLIEDGKQHKNMSEEEAQYTEDTYE